MKADLSRSTFSPQKHYRDVRWQMGRVPLDADFNEYVDLAAHRVETETIDVVGKCGGPIHDAAFLLTDSVAALPAAQQAAATALGALAAGDFLISAGRYYVQGVLVENDAPLKFSGQAAGDLPGAAPIGTPGLYLAFLDVWARHLTYLDDSAIREVALGGPDTATRNKNVWQLKLVRVGNVGTAPDCDAPFEAFSAETAVGTGQLAAEVEPDLTTKKPCVIPPGGGYRRLENQLYRVEIHDQGAAGGTATFKWSRDNGAIVSGWETTSATDTIRLKQPPRDQVMGFAPGQWVELTDDTNDLNATPGQLFEVSKLDGDLLKLKSNVPAGVFVRNLKVRRWDSVNKLAVTTGAWLALEDGVRVRFTTGTYKTGDHWMIPARTATADVEWPRPGGTAAFVSPHGIKHGYCRVGFVEFSGTAISFHDCRNLFPPLTEIDRCDLKLHNKHLHGKGVVCGLQVVCGGDGKRETVTIKPGHAIDCEGTDILLKTPATFPVVARAKDLKLLDAAGTGEALLTLRADTEEKPVFDLQAAPAEPVGLANIVKHLLEGTLWMDFFNDCLKPLVDFLRDALLTRDPADKSLVTIQEKRVLTVTNAYAHLSANLPNRRLWLSKEQHKLLQELYEGLVKFAGHSETFCAIADSFPEFPKFPFGARQIATGFVARRAEGAAVSPDGRFAALWGGTTAANLYVFDLAKGELVVDRAVEGAAGLAVRDVAFAEFQKKPVAVVLSGNASRAVLTLLEAEKFTPVASPLLLDANSLLRIVTHSRRPGTVLGVERGAGVHVLDLDKLSSGPLGGPQWKFPATGQLEIEADRACATATLPVAGGPAPVAGTYNAVVFATLRTGEDSFENEPRLLQDTKKRPRSGDDGLTFGIAAGQPVVHIAVNPAPGETAKGVLLLGGRGGSSVLDLALPLADDGTNTTGPVALGASVGGGQVAYALKNRSQLVWAAADGTKFSAAQTIPAQAAPVALARSKAEGGLVLAVNQESQTLTLIGAKEFESAAVTDAQLDAYRDDVIAAFKALFLPLLQGIKDCLCQHLLLDCPECAENETLPLAKIEIRGGRVFHICNFERLEVLTFPKVKYWLSVVPVVPLVSFLVEKFCCWVFAQPAETDPATGARKTAATLSPETVFGAAKLLGSGDFKSVLSSNFLRAQTLTTHFLQDAGRRAVLPASEAEKAAPKIGDVLEQNTDAASAALAAKGVNVAAVESYDAALGSDRAKFSAGALPTTLKAGESVKLFTRGGKVAFYQVVSEPQAAEPAAVAPAATGGATAETSPQVKAEFGVVRAELEALRASQAAELAARDAETAKLKAAGELLARELSARDRQLAELKTGNEKLAQEVSKLAATGGTAPTTAPAGVSAAEVERSLAALRTEIATQQRKSAEELAARDRQIAELKSANDKLANEVTVTNRQFAADIKKLSTTRPNG